MPLTGEIQVGVSAETICARTARDLVIMLENALMLRFATIVVFQGTLLLNAPQNPCAGIAKNLATWPAIVQMRAFATPVVKLATVLGSAQLHHCLQGT
uniref:Uncharacterized protein n=1 Tax=Medicago truncatula TaxID=3880 RepID=I3SVI5_MEDTR|nr:unknown [Medicago truncatula]